MQSSQSETSSLWQKIEQHRVGMLTTTDAKGSLVSRPMTSQKADQEGSLWFFASADAAVTQEIERNPSVNASFSAPDDSVYVSVSGMATVIHDKAIITTMWNPFVSAWFPGGPEDPQVALLKLTVHFAEYWDSDKSKMMQLYSMAKAAVTGEAPTDIGEHRKFTL